MGGGDGYRNGAVGPDSKGSGWKECASSELEQECSSRLPGKAWTPRGRETQEAQARSAKHTAQNYASPGSPALPVGSQPRQEGAEAGGGPDSLPPGPGTWDVDSTGLPCGREPAILPCELRPAGSIRARGAPVSC